MTEGAANYEFMLERARTLLRDPRAKVLDYGCGQGTMVALGLARGLNIHGADTFAGAYEDWADKIAAGAQDRIARIADGKLPFSDATFDVVISNMVFEHVEQPLQPLEEIARVLKPGGAFLACFPTGDVWFEGHVGVYFPHFLRSWPAMQRGYLFAVRRLGFGYYADGVTAAHWVGHMQQVMRDVVFYHRWRPLCSMWRSVFGSSPQSLASDYMAFRLARVPGLARVAHSLGIWPLKPLAEFICHKRAARVLLVRKPA